jgi:hypothetical protein
MGASIWEILVGIWCVLTGIRENVIVISECNISLAYNYNFNFYFKFIFLF